MTNQTKIIIGAAAATLLLFVSCGGCVVVGLLAWPNIQEASRKGQAAQDALLPTREEMHKKLMGKTKDEVKTLIGIPENTLQYSNGIDEDWTYRKRLQRDAITNRSDSYLVVIFKHAKVDHVSPMVPRLKPNLLHN